MIFSLKMQAQIQPVTGMSHLVGRSRKKERSWPYHRLLTRSNGQENGGQSGRIRFQVWHL